MKMLIVTPAREVPHGRRLIIDQKVIEQLGAYMLLMKNRINIGGFGTIQPVGAGWRLTDIMAIPGKALNLDQRQAAADVAGILAQRSGPGRVKLVWVMGNGDEELGITKACISKSVAQEGELPLIMMRVYDGGEAIAELIASPRAEDPSEQLEVYWDYGSYTSFAEDMGRGDYNAAYESDSAWRVHVEDIRYLDDNPPTHAYARFGDYSEYGSRWSGAPTSLETIRGLVGGRAVIQTGKGIEVYIKETGQWVSLADFYNWQGAHQRDDSADLFAPPHTTTEQDDDLSDEIDDRLYSEYMREFESDGFPTEIPATDKPAEDASAFAILYLLPMASDKLERVLLEHKNGVPEHTLRAAMAALIDRDRAYWDVRMGSPESVNTLKKTIATPLIRGGARSWALTDRMGLTADNTSSNPGVTMYVQASSRAAISAISSLYYLIRNMDIKRAKQLV